MPDVVLDVNVLVSGLINPRGPNGNIQTAWRNGKIRVITSSAIIAKTDEVLHRPHIVKLFSPSRVVSRLQELLRLLREETIIVPHLLNIQGVKKRSRRRRHPHRRNRRQGRMHHLRRPAPQGPGLVPEHPGSVAIRVRHQIQHRVTCAFLRHLKAPSGRHLTGLSVFPKRPLPGATYPSLASQACPGLPDWSGGCRARSPGVG